MAAVALDQKSLIAPQGMDRNEPVMAPPLPSAADLKNEDSDLCCPNGIASFGATVCFCAWCCACVQVQERQEKIFLHLGKYTGALRKPGCYCVNPMCVSTFETVTSRESLDLKSVKVADARANPLIISGIVTYQVVESRKATLDVKNVHSYIENQGLAVLKRVASMYPYEGKNPEDHSLKSEAGKLGKMMIELLQDRCSVAGVLITGFELTDLSYAPEIAQAMLVKQQSEALIDARKIIVDGAVGIAQGAIKGLNDRGIRFNPEKEADLVSNLLLVICGDSKVSPVVNVGGGHK
jgi:regulator of protease activity HflC (stomatin/prohibitin superfamily)